MRLPAAPKNFEKYFETAGINGPAARKENT
jgi:hypothetical protein